MAPIVLSAAEREAALLKPGSDIQFLFEKQEVPEDIQAIFYHVGITTIQKLASFADNVADLKQVLKDDFDLDSARNIQSRVQVGSCCCAYSIAVQRAGKQAEIEGELDAKRVAKPLPASDFTAMRRTWEAKWWTLSERWVPARSYLEKRADELEQGELRAEPLTEVICREEDNPDLMVPVWNSTGNLTVRKASCTAPEPANSEQLRYRITLMGHCIMFLALRHSNRTYLQGLSPQLFSDYLEYLLGDFVWTLTARSAEGHTLGAPAWAQVVSYEWQIRRKAYCDMQKSGINLRDALTAAWNCPITKERYFTTPLALTSTMGNKRGPDPQWPGQGRGQGSGGGSGGGRGQGQGRGKAGGRGRKGGGKGGGKGRKGGKGGGKGGCAARTPDGQMICFAYNSEEGCKLGQCNFLHVCGLCFAKGHPLYQCSGNGGRLPGETQGKGAGTN